MKYLLYFLGYTAVAFLIFFMLYIPLSKIVYPFITWIVNGI